MIFALSFRDNYFVLKNGVLGVAEIAQRLRTWTALLKFNSQQPRGGSQPSICSTCNLGKIISCGSGRIPAPK